MRTPAFLFVLGLLAGYGLPANLDPPSARAAEASVPAVRLAPWLQTALLWETRYTGELKAIRARGARRRDDIQERLSIIQKQVEADIADHRAGRLTDEKFYARNHEMSAEKTQLAGELAALDTDGVAVAQKLRDLYADCARRAPGYLAELYPRDASRLADPQSGLTTPHAVQSYIVAHTPDAAAAPDGAAPASAGATADAGR